MKAIASVDLGYGIGYRGALLVRIPDDLKRFKKITMGRTVVMGRSTYESLPGKKALPGRRNVILSSTLEGAEGFCIAHSVQELLQLTKDTDTSQIYVIGGGRVYGELLAYCDEVNLTVVEHRFEADAFFPRIAESDEWERKGVSETFSYDLIKYHFEDYVRRPRRQ